MTNKIDLIGKRVGKLTVLKLADKRGHNKAVLWECRCECGNYTTATTTQLKKGTKKSCGCLKKKSPPNVLDLTGKRFGKLTVIERVGATKKYNALWLCRCDCGNTTKARGTSLKRGETVSCGCMVEDRVNKMLKVLNEDKSIDGVVVPLLTKKVRSDSKTGHKGVSKRVRKGKEYYEVYITIPKTGKKRYVGSFKDLNKAIEARRQAEIEYHQPYIKALEGKKNERY
jgi:hypothetical protein